MLSSSTLHVTQDAKELRDQTRQVTSRAREVLAASEAVSRRIASGSVGRPSSAGPAGMSPYSRRPGTAPDLAGGCVALLMTNATSGYAHACVWVFGRTVVSWACCMSPQ